MPRLNKTSLIVGIGLTLVVALVSINIFSTWLGFGWLGIPVLFAIAFYTVTVWIANARKAYFQDTPPNSGTTNSITSIQGSNIAGRDVIHVVNNVYPNTTRAPVKSDEDLKTIVREFNRRIVKAHQTWSLYTRSLIRPTEPPTPSRGDVADSMNALVDYLNDNGYILSAPLKQNIVKLLNLFNQAWAVREIALSLVPFQSAGHRESGLQIAKFHDEAATIIINDVPPVIEQINAQIREMLGVVDQTVSITAWLEKSEVNLPDEFGIGMIYLYPNLHVRIVNHNRDYPLNVDTLHFVTSKGMRILLRPFNAIPGNAVVRKFAVGAQQNTIYVASGEALAKNLRELGYSGMVSGVVELTDETDHKSPSSEITIAIDDLGQIEKRPNP